MCKNRLDRRQNSAILMPMNITLKNIPAFLHQRLKERFAEHGRSLSKEIIAILELNVFPQKLKGEDFLRQIRKKRAELKLHLTIEEVESAIEEGRS